MPLAEQRFAPGDATVIRRRIFFSEVRVPEQVPLPLAGRGLIVRSRRGPDGGDVTLKLRGPQGCIDTRAWKRRTRRWDAKLEGDWAGAKRMVSASLTHDLRPDDGGDTDPRNAHDVLATMSKAQRKLARQWMVPLEELEPLGPVESRRWTVSGLDGVVEVWTVDELAFLEFSTHAPAEDAEAAQLDLRRRLIASGLDEDALVSATKTETVLRHLMNRQT